MERGELSANLEELNTALQLWSLNEPQIVGPLKGMGSCVENCNTALKALVREGGREEEGERKFVHSFACVRGARGINSGCGQ